MIELGLKATPDRSPKFMFIGAHSDDIEIGCGGTILNIQRAYPEAAFLWVVLSGNKARRLEAEQGASRFLESASNKTIRMGSFTDGFFPSEKAAIKGFFESELKMDEPDVIFTHARDDLHQDHQVVNQLTSNTFRNQLILEYEIPKYDGDIGNPNTFVELSTDDIKTKCDILMDVFASQSKRHWFRKSLFEGLAAVRGMQCAASSGFAEGFYNRKSVLKL